MLDYTRSHLYYANINGCMSFGPSLLSSTNNGIVKSIVFLLIFVSIKDLHNIKIMSAIKHFFSFILLHGEVYKQIFIQFSSNFQLNSTNIQRVGPYKFVEGMAIDHEDRSNTF